MTTKRPTLSLKPRPAPSKASARPRPAGQAQGKGGRPGGAPDERAGRPANAGPKPARRDDAPRSQPGGPARRDDGPRSPQGGPARRDDGPRSQPTGTSERGTDTPRANPRPPAAAQRGAESRPANPHDPAAASRPAPDAARDNRDGAPARAAEAPRPESPWAQRSATRAERPRAERAAPRAEPGLRASYEVRAPLQTAYRPDTLKTDSLAFALLGAANATAMVRADGLALPQALGRVSAIMEATPQARGAIQDIAYRTMRQLGRAETLLALLAPKQPEPPMLAMLLCAALTLVDVPDGSAPPYEPFTVVDQAVTAATAHPDLVRAKGMVNAVLRRFLREKDTLLAAALQNEVARYNYPQWWIDATRAAYPNDWQRILEEGNRPPPLTLRVNARHTSAAAYIERLRQAGMEATQVGPTAVRLEKPVPVHQIPGFDEGVVSVQDAGAQLAAPLMEVADGMRVLDACAAPGGKTGHILESADVTLTAVDADPERLKRVQENLDRLHLHAELIAAEAQTTGWWDGQPFDRIVADVPCTASGIVRRHPDIRWLRRKSDTLQLATLATQILDNLWPMLKPGGKFLFVTCSLWPQESEAQAAAFAARHGAPRLPAPGQLLPAHGAQQDHDGLFYALFEKSVAPK